jgi:hypothetical protein
MTADNAVRPLQEFSRRLAGDAEIEDLVLGKPSLPVKILYQRMAEKKDAHNEPCVPLRRYNVNADRGFIIPRPVDYS